MGMDKPTGMDKPIAGSRQTSCLSPRVSPCCTWKWFCPCISCTRSQHLSAGDPLALHTSVCTIYIKGQTECTEQHILPCGRSKRYPKNAFSRVAWNTPHRGCPTLPPFPCQV